MPWSLWFAVLFDYLLPAGMSIVKSLSTFSSRLLQEAQNGETQPNAFVTLWREKPKLVCCYIAALVIAIIACYFILRDFLYRKWGIELYPKHVSPQQQRLEDERLAIEMQLEVEELEHQELIVARRIERRQKYKQFLAPFTMVSFGMRWTFLDLKSLVWIQTLTTFPP